jgi:outer membrane protein assembly factor BamA
MYDIPYVDKGKRFGAGFGGGVMKNREVAFDTRSDKLEFLFSREYPVEQWFTSFHFSFRPKYHTTYLVDFRVQSVSFSDTLLRLNPLFSYRGKSSLTFLNFYYKVKIDYRDTKYYPLDGWYADLEFNKAGLGLRFEGPVNLFWMKSTLRFFLPVSGRWYAGAGAIARISSPGSQPYFFKQGMGYVRDFVRGYEYYVIEGQQYAIFKSTIKFALVPEFSTEIRFIPTEKFSRIHFASYLTAFADAGCTWKQSGTPASGNVLPGTLLLSGGLGLDFVTYYDKVLRIEYAVNKKGESGIFIHLIAGI